MSRPRILLLVGLPIAALIIFALIHPISVGAAQPSLSNFQPLDLTSAHRLLVIAPHSDDETLGAGGTILTAVRQGIDVRVVIVTNGDGYLFATIEEFRRVFPTAADYIRMGQMRQKESLAALATLGVPADHVYFLSYPDRGTQVLWNRNWLASTPYRSVYTGTSQSPYQLTYDPKSVYAGEDLLRDLRSILHTDRPDLIIYPHPEDVHPDHWAVSAFTRLAISLEEHDDPAYQPQAVAYLVHRSDFPAPKEFLPDGTLLPPLALYRISPDWIRVDLSHDDAMLKWKALQQYRSQLSFLKELFQGMVRRNDLFQLTAPAALPTIASGDATDPTSWRNSSGEYIPPLQRDPSEDVAYRDALPGSDLTALYAGRLGQNELTVCLEARGNAVSTLDYAVRTTAVTSSGVTQHVARRTRQAAPTGMPVANGRFFCDRVSLADLGNPWEVFLGGEVRGPQVGVQFGVLDQIAWQLVTIEPTPSQAPSASGP